MTIMVAGGLTFAAPGMMPGAEADHNQYLFVSAENAEFANKFDGAQIVEVVIRDPDISSTELGIPGIPKVEVNGDKMAMVQGSDGAWYAYFGDDKFVSRAAALGTSYGLEYGSECTNTIVTSGSDNDPYDVTGIDDTSIFADISSFFVAGTCTDTAAAVTANTYIVRSAQAINSVGASDGNVGMAATTTSYAGTWPFIQTYDFSDGPAEVCYLKSQANECVLLDFDDTDSFNSISTDRSV